MTLPLLLGMALLIAVTLGFLLWPLIRNANRAAGADISRSNLNAAVFRDQLKELERDRVAGSLSEPAFAQSTLELQRRALADTAAADPAVASATRTGMPTRLVVGLVIMVPLAAALLYAWLGNPDATREQANPAGIASKQIDDMVAQLAARLEKNPDDPKGWAMLARSYKALGRYELAERAFDHLGGFLDQDANLLADYAEVLARKANGNFDGKPQAALDKALAIESDNAQALALTGIAAYQRQAYGEAAGYWERLLAVLPADSEQAKSVADSIAKARSLAGDQPRAIAGTSNSGAAKPDKKKVAAAPAASAVSGRVSVAPALAAQVKPGDTLFIFARAVDGPRVPLAVLRTTAAALPLDFTLNDSQSMSPQFKLSTLPAGSKVQVEGRVSKSGEALPKSGDFIGAAAPVSPGTKGVNIVIERTVP